MTAPPATVYAIATQRMLMRCVEPADAAAFRTLAVKNADRLARWQDPALFGSFEAIADWLRRARSAFDGGQTYAFTIFRHQGGEPIGFSSLDPRHPAGGFEITGWFDSDHEGESYAYEGSAALTRLAFEHYGARRVEMYCDTDNERVHRLLARLGFRHEATLRRRVVQDGEPRDRMLWSVHDCDFAGTPSSACELFGCDALGAVVFATEPAPRPPAGTRWGGHEIGWQALIDHLAERYPRGRAPGVEAGTLFTAQVSVQGATHEQRVEVQLGRVLDEPVLVVSAPVGAEAAMELREALAHNATLVVGALALVGDGYALRHSLALAGLTAHQLDRVVLLLAHEAVRLREGHAGAGGAELYGWLVTPGSDKR